MRLPEISSQTRMSLCRWIVLLILSGTALFDSVCVAATATNAVPTSRILSPLPHQVIQRRGFVPSQSYYFTAGQPQLGSANVSVAALFPTESGESFQFRLLLQAGCTGSTNDWTELPFKREGDTIKASIKVMAGGWYDLEVKQSSASGSRTNHVEDFGVGDVFIIAGQSYAEGCNEERLKVEDPYGRVAAFDLQDNSWRIAHDPQPNVRNGGTIWPPAGSYLVGVSQVPVGFINVALSATSSKAWLPPGANFQKLRDAGIKMKDFRAVLWQQGESDVIEKTSTEDYVANILKLRTTAVEAWGFDPPWLVAKSTHHPLYYQDPEGQLRIRKGYEYLIERLGFKPGPDTDLLGGDNRSNTKKSAGHFTGLGQRRAGLLWFNAIWNELQSTSY